MDYLTDIEFWEDINGNSPITDFLSGTPLKAKKWIIKKNSYFEQLTVEQLRKSKYLEPVEGTEFLILELKYFTQPPYRMLCTVWKQKLVGLVMFQGSGTKEISKNIKQAIDRASYWKNNN
ncbi:MAG TPA: hypothetical protein VGC58_00805 [Candidatus Paceibacterota bacterium]